MTKTKKPQEIKSILSPLIVCSTPVVWVYTTEEYRMAQSEQETLLRKNIATQVFRWDVTGKLTEAMVADKAGNVTGGRETMFDHPRKVIEWFARVAPKDYVEPANNQDLAQSYAPAGSVLMMMDVAAMLQHPHGSKWSNPLLCRVVKNLIPVLSDKDSRKMLVIISHTMDIPQELEHTAVLAIHPLPTAQDLERQVRVACCNYFWADSSDSSQELKIEQDELDVVVGQLTGMRQLEADNVIARSVYVNNSARRADPTVKREFDLATIRTERVKSVRKNSTLEVITPTGGMEMVGGHDEIKRHVIRARKKFSREAIGEGLSSPKGILLCGFSGTGKTLIAKCIAHEWGATGLRGDVGACKNSLVGASESAFRKMLKDAEDQAGDKSPVVLQLDEAGKMFGGGLRNGGAMDSGVSSGLSAAYLTWRQECRKPVYVVMTANEDAQNFPMEWLRPGRLDRVFFVDLPNKEDRKEIFRIHMRQRNWAIEDIDLEALCSASDTFTPSEIEQAVELGIDIKWDEDGPRETAQVKTIHLIRGCGEIKPMSRSNKDEMDKLRQWAVDRGYVDAQIPVAPQVKMPKAAIRRIGSAMMEDDSD